MLGKKIGKVIAKEYDKDLILNSNYDDLQFIETICILANISDDNKMVRMAQLNLRNRGMNKSLESFSESVQLSAFLREHIKDAGGGVKANEDED